MPERTIKLTIKTRTGGVDKRADLTFTVDAESHEEAAARLRSVGARIMNYHHSHTGERVELYKDGELMQASERIGGFTNLCTAVFTVQGDRDVQENP